MRIYTHLASLNPISFGIFQPPFGTSPTATQTNDTLILTSSDSSIVITGNAGTKTLDFKIGSIPAADLPPPGASTLGGVFAFNPGSNQFLTSVLTTGGWSSAQVGFSNIAGTIGPSQIPALSGVYFQQGGNSFGAKGALRTNDNNNLDIGASGSMFLTLGVSGQVGIGTTAPICPLYIKGSNTVGYGQLAIENAGNGAPKQITFQSGPTLATDLSMQIFHLSSNSFIRSYNGTSQTAAPLILNDTGGNVGVGTAAPAYIFDVSMGRDSGVLIDAENTSNTANAWAGYQIRNNVGTMGWLWSGSASYGGSLGRSRIELTTAAGLAEGIDLVSSTTTTGDIRMLTGGFAQANERLRIDGTGKVGIATTTPSYLLDVVGNIASNSAGSGFRIREGSNAKMGTSVLVAGAVVVANTSVGVTSRIFATSQVDGGVPGFLRISARTAGSSFTITSSNIADTSTVAWLMMEPS